ncbi:MAG: 3-isopropylmalate dehydratase small subunit [Alphaproteobacteria bacterium]|nr:MAG: 3-isopropylmalate dehydratase small subunit [Alphaproteobacteria bacterium]
MEPFKKLAAVSLPLLRINVDTDCIIPSREMKKVSKTGLGEGLFAGWRYTGTSGRRINPEFILNDAKYKDAQILLSGMNFGCGSSREHAVWALAEYGFRAILAPSFGGIFYNNCICNGLLPVVLPEGDIALLAEWIIANPAENQLVIDLEKQIVSGPEVIAFHFDIFPQDKEMLLRGFDMIDMTLKRQDEITAFEERDKKLRAWAIPHRE